MSCKRIIFQNDHGTELKHVFILPEDPPPFPAVLLFHEYTGLNSVTVNHAERLAAEGYAVLAADFYGTDNRPDDMTEARAIHRIYRNDRLLMRARSKTCLQALTEQPEVDPKRIFGLGFSFGGGAVLELARTGAGLQSAISIYGYLDTSHAANPGEIKCSLLAIHVENDPVVPQQHAAMFENEMNSAEVSWKIIRIKNAKHGFANPEDPGFNTVLAEEMWIKVLEWINGT